MDYEDGEPPQLVQLKDLRKQLPDWEGDRLRVAFGHQIGAAPMLANDQNMFQIQNDMTLIPWQQHVTNARLRIEKHLGEKGGSPFGSLAPERLEVLGEGQFFLWEQQILNQHLAQIWGLGGGKPVVKMAVKEAIAAVAYPGKRTIKVRHHDSQAKAGVFKFKLQISVITTVKSSKGNIPA